MMASAMTCGRCRFAGSDVSIVGCGCTLHAKCVPINLVATVTEAGYNAVQPQSILCPVCNASAVQGIRLFPLSLDDLDRAVEIRKNAKKASKKDQEFQVIETETVYMHLLHSGNGNSVSASLTENEHQRTGRWTSEEIAFVDFLVDAFNRGVLPMAQGVRLNDFLGEMLMCKGSRLTKKMKNARLSSRSYQLSAVAGGVLDCPTLSTMEEKFYQSIQNEATRVELRFNVSRAWRSHFSNFCLQIGSNLLDANDWITSLETMERRAAKAEETIRKARRRRMGLALKTDVRAAQTGVFFAGMAAHRSSKTPNLNPVTSAVSLTSSEVSRGDKEESASVHSSNGSDDGSQSEFISHVLDFGSGPGHGTEFSKMFNELLEVPDGDRRESPSSFLNNNSAGPFMEELVAYMENNDLPFQHADVWVPSESPIANFGGKEMRLFHAGFATRRDVDPALFWQLSEYGEYSTKFSFAPGVGLPGRVYNTKEASWECRIDLADPKVFERAGGAKVYGVKTGFGLPVTTRAIGRIVVVMYSTLDVPMDRASAEKWVRDLQAFCPEPTWKLVVEMGGDGKESSHQPRKPVPPFPASQGAGVLHYEHSHKIADSDSPVLYSHSEEKMPASVSPKVEFFDIQEEEQKIATLLGEHMPLSDLPPPVGIESGKHPASPDVLLPHFMSLRLLLLRSACHRSKDETEKIDVIVRSYRGYSQDKRRSDKDLACLLVQDWYYLTAVQGLEDSKKPAATQKDAHQCHVMEPTGARTHHASGAPTKMPPSLFYAAPPSPGLGLSSDVDDGEGGSRKKRRVSSAGEMELSSGLITER